MTWRHALSSLHVHSYVTKQRLVYLVAFFVILSITGGLLLSRLNIPLSLPFFSTSSCTKSQKLECLNDALRKETATYGIPRAFKTFTALYNSDPTFVTMCHAVSHGIGEEAFVLYKNGKGIAPVPEMTYCGFGFYHGFMIALLADWGDPKRAREFCDELVTSAHGQFGNQIMASCLHGFGHGISAELSEASVRANATASIHDQLHTCEQIGQNPWEVTMCAGGVYNALGEILVAMKDASSTLSYLTSPSDTFSLCRIQKQSEFRDGCIRNFNAVLGSNVGNSFEKGLTQILMLSTHDEAALAMQNFTGAIAHEIKDDQRAISKAVEECNSAPAYVHNACLKGYINGFIEFSTPGEEYKSALSFCNDAHILSVDRELCFMETSFGSQNLYTKEKYGMVCDLFPKEFRAACKERKKVTQVEVR